MEANSILEEKPGTKNKGPEVEGWLARIEIKNKKEMKNSMSEEEYDKFTERLKIYIRIPEDVMLKFTRDTGELLRFLFDTNTDGNTLTILNGQRQRLQWSLKASTHEYPRLEPLDLAV